jgi:uncharacterized protein YdhG (YjbR/CyaY superfamily)
MGKTIGSYLKTIPRQDRPALEELRHTINSVARFEEGIAYGMPAFKHKGKVVACFRSYAHHIGLYPYSGSILKDFSAELKSYKTSVGAVQLPKDKRLPKTLIRRIIKARMKEIDERQVKPGTRNDRVIP